METRAHHVLIGLLTLLTAGAALLFALWLGKSSVDSNYHDYEVVFSEAVNGLSAGSPVQYSGIKVGDVVHLRLDPKNPSRVLAHIRVGADTPIKQDTQAKLTLAGITGTSFIQLSSSSAKSPPLLPSKDNPRPRIIAQPSPISRLVTDGSELMNKVSTLLTNANLLFSAENAGNFSQTLSHLQQTTGTSAEQREDLRQAMIQFALLSKQANQTLQQANALLANSNRLLTENGSRTLQDAQQAMASLQRSSAAIEQLLSQNQAALGEGMHGLRELGPAIRELRQTLANLKGITQRVDANPAGYLLGREQPKEFQP